MFRGLTYRPLPWLTAPERLCTDGNPPTCASDLFMLGGFASGRIMKKEQQEGQEVAERKGPFYVGRCPSIMSHVATRCLGEGEALT